MFSDKTKLIEAFSTVLDSYDPKAVGETFFDLSDKLPHMGDKKLLKDVTNSTLDSKISSKILCLNKSMSTTSEAVMGEISDMVSGSANFDWNSNPANADFEVIACEFVRKLTGLKNEYSYAQEHIEHGGLGVFLPHDNEALLLSYHSTVYDRGHELAHKFVVYGINRPERHKPFLFRSCTLVFETPFKDDLKTIHDIDALRTQIKGDIEKGLIPHFLVCPISDLDSMEHLIDEYQAIASEFGLKLFIDLSELGIQVLKEPKCSKINANFILFDMSELSHLSSAVLFLKDLKTYAKTIASPPMEYLKQPKSLVTETKTKPEDKKTHLVEKLNAYDFTIGFSNYVSHERFLYVCLAKGKKGILEDIRIQHENLNSIARLLSSSSIVDHSKQMANHVVAHLKSNSHELAAAFRKVYKTTPFHLVKNNSHLVKFYAPLSVKLEEEQVRLLLSALETLSTN